MEDWLPAAPTPLVLFGIFFAIGLLELLRPARPERSFGEGRVWANLLLYVACRVTIALPALAGVAASLAPPALHLDMLGRSGLEGPGRVVLALLAMDLFGYASHLVHHKVPLLWRLHAVHHADPDPDVTSQLRHHPLEAVVGAAAFGLLVLVLGLSPGEVGLFLVIGWTVQCLAHANLALPRWLARPMAWVVVTPEFHAVHHHRDLPWTDSNYGGVLTLWDRIFGTARRCAAPPDFGLAEYAAPADQRIGALLLKPLRPRPAADREAPARS